VSTGKSATDALINGASSVASGVASVAGSVAGAVVGVVAGRKAKPAASRSKTSG
jgi:hypothetical protein